MSSGSFKGRAAIDREAFFEMVGFRPHPGQRRLIDNFLPEYGGKRFAAVAAGTRWGKDWVAAHLMAAAMIAPNEHEFTGWCVGPYLNLADIGFGYVCSLFTNHLPHMIQTLKSHDGILEVTNLLGKPARLYRRTAERGAVALTGSSVDLAWLIEASAIDSAIVEQSIMTRLTDRMGALLALSTPRGISGFFPDLVRRGMAGSDDTFGMRSPSWENDRLDRKELFRMKQRMRPAAWAQEMEARFVSFTGAVYDPEVIRRQARGRPQRPDESCVYYGGYDAASNRDFNVLVIGKRTEDGRCEVVHCDRFNKLDTDATVERIARTCHRYQVSGLAADATGMGKPLCDLLRARDVSIVPTVLTQQSKAALVAGLGSILDQDRMVLLAPEHCPEMALELEKYQFTNEAGTSTSAPIGSHDDVVMALCLLGSWWKSGDLTGRVHRFMANQRSPVDEVEDVEETDDEIVDDGPRIITSGDAIPAPGGNRRSLRNPFNLRIRF